MFYKSHVVVRCYEFWESEDSQTIFESIGSQKRLEGDGSQIHLQRNSNHTRLENDDCQKSLSSASNLKTEIQKDSPEHSPKLLKSDGSLNRKMNKARGD